MPLDTHKGWQYTTYYNRERRLSVARRTLPNGAWEVIHFEDYVFKGNDNHNVTVLGICRKDGTIHLSFDHHNDPLHYRVSKPGVAIDPDNVQWDASLFGEVRDYLKKGRRIKSVTYPQFVPTPQGGLLFVSRDGVPTNGRVTLAEYDPTKGVWSDRWDVSPHQGQEVMQGQYVDGLDRPHVVISHLREGEKPLPVGKRDPGRSATYHYWRDSKGKWHQNEVYYPIGSGVDSERNRAKILSTLNNDMIAMFNDKASIVLMSATAENGYRDWKVMHKEEGPWDGEPLPDLSRWREEGVLSIYMQKDPSKDGEPTDLYVVDYSVSAAQHR